MWNKMWKTTAIIRFYLVQYGLSLKNVPECFGLYGSFCSFTLQYVVTIFTRSRQCREKLLEEFFSHFSYEPSINTPSLLGFYWVSKNTLTMFYLLILNPYTVLLLLSTFLRLSP